MKKAAAFIICCTLLFLLSCTGMIKKVQTSLVTVTLGSDQAAMLEIRPYTLAGQVKRFLGRTFTMPIANAAIPAIVQNLRLTVSASDMTTISATVNVAGLSSADFIVDVPNGSQRHFVVEGLDAGATPKYRGDAYADLNGDPVLLTITMAVVEVTPPTFAGLSGFSNVSLSGVTLHWPRATDNATSSANMVYLIYQATTPGGEDFTKPSYTTAAGASSYTVSGLLGTNYYFVVRAQDEAGNTDSNSIERSRIYPGLHVDAVYGSDTGNGTQFAPFKTITKALTVTNGYEGILVRRGTYSPASGEVFPLVLKSGTSLICSGSNFNAVIDDSTGLGDTPMITGALGALIEGCGIITADNASVAAVDDNGLPITVNNCSLKGGSLSMALTGIQLSANSTVKNSTIAGFNNPDLQSAGLRVAQNAQIFGNTFSGNFDGVYVSAGSPVVSGNAFTGNTNGVKILDGSPTINNNTIENSGAGTGIVSSSASIIGPLISNNTINGNYYGIEVDAGTPSVNNNTISGGTYGIYAFSGTPTINNNTITTNLIGIWAANGIATITGNSVSYNSQSGIYISSSTSPVITGNSLFCNTEYDMNISAAVITLDISNNSWDHTTPTSSGYPSVCTIGTDICISGLMTLLNTTAIVVPTPCP